MPTQENLDNWFKFHPASPAQQGVYERIRATAKVLAETIVELTPAGADQSAAIRKVREAVMTANAAIACGGNPSTWPTPEYSNKNFGVGG